MYLWIRTPYPNSLHLSELATFSRLPAIHFKAPYALRLRTYCPLATSAVKVTLTLPCIVTLFPTRTRLGETSERYPFVILLFAALCIPFSQVTLSCFLELAALYVVFRTSKPQSLPCQAALLHCALPHLEDWQIPGLKLVRTGSLYGMREQMCIS
jgi:hypothetical protein